MLESVKNFFKSFSVAGNIDKIKHFFSVAYEALQKVVVFINYAKEELEKNNVGANVLKVLPSVLSVVGTILSLIAKFGPLFGLNLPASAPVKKGLTADDVSKDLEDVLNKLKGV